MKKNILIFSGLSDKKLKEKILPILESDEVGKVFLNRCEPFNFSHPKLKQYNTVKFLRKVMPLSEVNRLILGFVTMFTQKVDILIGIHYLMHSIYAYLLAKLFGKKYIFLVIESPQKYKLIKPVYKFMSKGAARVGTKGSKSLNYMASLGVKKERLVVVPNEFSAMNIFDSSKQKKEYDLIYIGNFVDVKDLPLWINIFTKVQESLPSVKGVMLGDGIRYERIQQMAKEKNLDISFVGRVTNTMDYVDKSKLLLLTSVSEGLPMVVVESMSRGVPSVCTNVGDISDIVEHEKNGLTIDSRNPVVFAKEIVELLQNKEKYTVLSKNALGTLKKEVNDFSHENIVLLWNNIFMGIN